MAICLTSHGKQTFIIPLALAPEQLTTLSYSIGGKKNYDIDDFFGRNNDAGLLIIKDSEIVMERYAQGNNESSRWMSVSNTEL